MALIERNMVRHIGRRRYYICLDCGETISKKIGSQCQDGICPVCGAMMVHIGSHRHRKWLMEKVEKDEV